jgi:hypothetical protein
MKVIIDRFEGDFAVVELENKILVDMPRELLPEGAGEGTVLKIEIDNKETKNRSKRIQKLMDAVWE